MDCIKIEHLEMDIDRVSIQTPPVNILTQQLLEEFITYLNTNSPSGLIITGADGIFSAGLDFKALAQEEDKLQLYLQSFLSLVQKLSTFNKPLIFAISGHCAAGGTVLALTGDYRIMQEGKYQMGLNELEIGLPVPAMIVDLMSNIIGTKNAYQSIMFSTRFNPTTAYNIGLIDQLSEKVQEDSLLKMKAILQLEPTAWSLTKQNLKRELNEKMMNSLTEDTTSIIEFCKTETFKKSLQKVFKK